MPDTLSRPPRPFLANGAPRPRAVYLLHRRAFGEIYGPEEQADIATRVEVMPCFLTPDDFPDGTGSWPGVEIIFSGWDMARTDEAFLSRFPDLKILFYGAGTIKGFATEALWRRGVRVTTAAAANAVPVSEFSLSQILFALKQGWQLARLVRAEKRYPSFPPPPGGYRSTVGLVSLGLIGRMVAERLRSFDVRVAAYDPCASARYAAEWGIDLVPLDELFRRADVVSCHAPLLEETEGMIGARHFEAMRRGSTFINTARGAIVDEKAMISVLERRPDLTAVLDVTHPEPPIPGSPLYSLENVVLTPHIAGSLGPECRRMGRAMVEELDRFLAGKPLLHEVTEARAAAIA